MVKIECKLMSNKMVNYRDGRQNINRRMLRTIAVSREYVDSLFIPIVPKCSPNVWEAGKYSKRKYIK